MSVTLATALAIESAREAFSAADQLRHKYSEKGEVLALSLTIEKAEDGDVTCTMGSSIERSDFTPDKEELLDTLIRCVIAITLEALVAINKERALVEFAWTVGDSAKVIIATGRGDHVVHRTAEDAAALAVNTFHVLSEQDHLDLPDITPPDDIEAFLDDLTNEISELFSSPELEERAAPYRSQLERNARDIEKLFRKIPALNGRLSPSAASGVEPEVIVDAYIREEAVTQVGRVRGGLSADDSQRLDELIIERVALYGELTCGFPCRIAMKSDGEELVRTWTDFGVGVPPRVFKTRWDGAPFKENLPYDRVAFLAGSTILNNRWRREGVGKVEVKMGRARSVTEHLPMKAAVLSAVDRFPIVFFEPKYLRRKLDEVTAVG